MTQLANNEAYFGTYCRMQSDSAREHIDFDPNATMLGTLLTLQHEVYVNERGKEKDRVIVSNSAHKEIGYLPDHIAQKIIAYFDQGWLCHACGAFIAYSKDESTYWLQLAIMCYSPDYKSEFDAFTQLTCKKIAAGDYPDLALSAKQIAAVIAADNLESSLSLAQLPKLGKNCVIYKRGRTSAEKLADLAIRKTSGCYLAMVIFALLVAAIIAFFVLR